MARVLGRRLRAGWGWVMVAKGIIVHWGLGAAGQGALCLWSNHCELCQWDGIGESVCQSFSGYVSHHSGCPASQGLVPVRLSFSHSQSVTISLSSASQLDGCVSPPTRLFGQSVSGLVRSVSLFGVVHWLGHPVWVCEL